MAEIVLVIVVCIWARELEVDFSLLASWAFRMVSFSIRWDSLAIRIASAFVIFVFVWLAWSAAEFARVVASTALFVILVIVCSALVILLSRVCSASVRAFSLAIL